MKYASLLEKLMCDKNVLPCHGPVWFTEEHLKEAEMVVVQIGTYQCFMEYSLGDEEPTTRRYRMKIKNIGSPMINIK
ncbi:unnamed protein product [Caenorhabditis brenneri]